MRLFARFGILGLFLLATVAAWAAPYVNLCFEGEDAAKISGKVFSVGKIAEDASGKVSGGKALVVPRYPPGEKPPKDSVVFPVTIPQDGVYYLWARTFWTNGCGNSIGLQVEGAESGDWFIGGDATYNIFHWVCLNDGGSNNSRPRPLRLKKGVVTFTLSARESGTNIDQLILTTDREKRPAGVYKPTPNVLAPVEKEKK